MKTILIHQSAFDRIHRTAIASKVETGGALLGFMGNPACILEAGGPGERSLRSFASYQTDAAEDMRWLRMARKKHGSKAVYLGSWHKHPAGMLSYSSVDLRQARQTLAGTKDGGMLLMGIIAEPTPLTSLKLRLYCLTSPSGDLEEKPYEIIHSTDDPRVQEAKAKATIIPDIAAMGNAFWDKPDFQFYTTIAGRARIRQDLASLRAAGWGVTYGRRRDDHSLIVHLSRHGESVFQLVFCPEYPINPPRIFDALDETEVHPNAGRPWNSTRTLVSVVAECSRNSESLKDFDMTEAHYGL